MWRFILFLIFLNNVFADEEKTKTVILDEGGVVGTKYWDGDFYEFFGIPYATAPTGRDRYQAPLPVKPWNNIFEAKNNKVVCYQSYFTEEDGKEFIVSGEDDCLLMNIFVPEIASEDNLVPIVVYVHSGAFSGGSGHMARFHFLARHDIIVISFNYRLGGIGFACLGNKEIPGNAGLKDQVAALRWIKKNIIKFGGDPNKVTIAGFSVGASMAELLSLSKTTDGLINQLILESASALSPFAINRDPIATAKNLALAMGYNGTGSLDDITEFYLNVSVEALTAVSLNFFLPNSTFGFSPCIENVHEGIEPFLTESPLDILKKGQNKKIPMLIGFSNMEGISRTIKFGNWRKRMTEDFSEFLPADLAFDNEKSKQDFIKEVKDRYFKGDEVTSEKLQGYIDYFSDAMFKYSIVKSLRLQAASAGRPIYFYEFSYVGKLNMQHHYMDRIKGASHRDQTSYILDFFGWTNSYKDLDMRDRMTTMWADFVKYGDPTAYESTIINYKWLPYTNENQNYLQISRRQVMKKNLFINEYNFWNKVYEKYHWNPTPPQPIKPKLVDVKENEVKDTINKAKMVNNESKTIDKDNKIKTKGDVKPKKEEPNIVSEVTKEDTKAKLSKQPIKVNKEEPKKEESNIVSEVTKGDTKAKLSKKPVEINKEEPKKEKPNIVSEVTKEDTKAKLSKQPIKINKEEPKKEEPNIVSEVTKEDTKAKLSKEPVKVNKVVNEVKKESIDNKQDSVKVKNVQEAKINAK